MKSAKKGHQIDKARLQELKKEHSLLMENLESLEGRLEDEVSSLKLHSHVSFMFPFLLFFLSEEHIKRI